MPPTVLVTGAAGFIGSHLTDRLLADGYTVIGIDNLQTGSLSNLQQAQQSSTFQFIKHDVEKPLVIGQDIEYIFHLACPAAPIHYQKQPVKTLRTSFLGTNNMLELARKHHARLLYTSTSEVYGDPLEHPQHETYWGNVNPIGPRSCYDEGKRAGESLCFSYHSQYGVDIRVVRIFNTYGPRMSTGDGRVTPNFILQSLQQDPITLFGTGDQTRSFCYVDDMVSALIAMMKQDHMIGPINLGNPAEISMRSLAETIIRLTQSSSKLTYHPLPQDDPHRRKPDITLAIKHLAWQPNIDLETGLRHTITYFKQNI